MGTGRRSRDHEPLLWRMRHSMGRVWFVIALSMVALGLFSVVYGLVVGTTDTIAPGLGLVVGGALLAVGFRRGARKR